MLFLPIKTNRQEEVVEEAGYLASASDLMVGLLFVFIIMVVILSRRIEVIGEPGKPGKPLDPLVSAVEKISDKMKQAGVPVLVDKASGVITFPADILFPRGVAELDPNGVRVLNQAKSALEEVLPCYIFSERKRRSNCKNLSDVEIETIFIEGHTDSIPLQRGIYSNWHLGLDRARAVYDILSNGQISQFKNERNLNVVGISSYADKRPAKGGLLDDSKNRRVELRFVLAYKPEVKKEKLSAVDVQKKIQQAVEK